jgi:hypothetical protein
VNWVFGGDVEEQAMTQEPLAPIHLSPTATNTNVNRSAFAFVALFIFTATYTQFSFISASTGVLHRIGGFRKANWLSWRHTQTVHTTS